VIFWLNMESAEKANYAGYAPGTLPDNLTSYKATGPLQVTMTTNKTYSSYWYTYNQLAEITPMPMAWDVTSTTGAAGSGGCTTDSAAKDKWAKCKAVFNFLNAQSKAVSSYASSPLWSVVDGPWKLSAFTAAGNDTMVPNAKYSGSPKPALSSLKFVPFTSDTTEYTALKTGSLDVGFIPAQDLPQRGASSPVPPTNPLGSGYKLAIYFPFGIFYTQLNFDGPLRAVFKQLYVRQALQDVTDQLGIIKAIDRGYGTPTAGPVPNIPPNQWTPASENANNQQGPYPFSVAAAKALLTSHGWAEQGGVMTCTAPAKCGAGIAKGTQLKFTLDYASGSVANQETYATYKSDASQAGMAIKIVGQTFNTIIGEATPCKPGPKCSWDALAYGGWLFNGPGFEPTGEPLFQTGAGSNSGSYSNPTMDSLINQTHTNSSLSVFDQYGTFGAQQLPFLWVPNGWTVQAYNAKLHNVTFNSLNTFLPEYWYLSK
jgi:peptide/nickel transport system substrate-binding protein